MFDIGGCNFGWKALEDLFFHEVERARTNQLRRVPDLKKSHIYRDYWTRLNVRPAKIMQVAGSSCFVYPVMIKCIALSPSKSM